MNDFLFKIKGEKLQCLLCPNLCVLNEGQYGLCKTRKRIKDKIVNPYSGIISSSGVDPIEKKPLYHFMPNSSIFSVGFFGCTLKCQFFQNYSISQYHPDENGQKTSPKEMVYLLKERNLKSIAFTYSEPLLYYEWVLETAILCHENNIKTILVTNGYLNPKPAEELLKHIDAANIDLKSGKDDFYKEICSGKLEPVKKFIEIAYKSKVHIEITTLIVTDTNDSIEEIIEILDFISSLSSDIPYHISRYHPDYNFNKPATPVSTIDKFIELSKKKLNYVYAGNIMGNSDTFCKKCNELLVRRNYYTTSIHKLDKNGKCTKCGTDNNFVL